MSSGPKTRPQNEEPVLDGFLRDLDALQSEAASAEAEAASQAQRAAAARAEVGLEPLAAALSPVSPDSALRARLLAVLPQTKRFTRFADAVAELLDIDHSAACELLDRLDDRSSFVEALPGVELLWVEGGPRVAEAVRGFVRIAAGQQFPEHEHLGEERVLVMQGAYTDEARGRSFRPGDVDVMPKHSCHGFVVHAGGPDLLVLSVVHGGLSIAGQLFVPQIAPNRR